MTRKFLAVLMSLTLMVVGFTFTAKAQQNPPSNLVRVNGLYYAQGYNQWSATVLTGTTTTGAATLSMLYGYVTLPDGRPFVPFNTNVPISVDVGAQNEVVTPSSVSGCFPLNPNQGVCQVTATFANTHGSGTIVSSGDFGIQEAILDAGNSGGGTVFWMVDTGILTLNLAGLTTTSTVKVPATFYNQGASARVTTTITGSTAWLVGTAAATGIFCASNATLTAGTLCTEVAPTLTGTGSTALTAVLVTATVANATAGAVKVRVWGYTPVSANS
jgi:hypothetical protein